MGSCSPKGPSNCIVYTLVFKYLLSSYFVGNYSDHFAYLWLVGNGGMGYNCNYYYYHSSIPY